MRILLGPQRDGLQGERLNGVPEANLKKPCHRAAASLTKDYITQWEHDVYGENTALTG
jgi:hypothetical protein